MVATVYSNDGSPYLFPVSFKMFIEDLILILKCFSRLIHDNRFSKDTVKNIRVFVSGSAPLSPAVWEDFKQRTGIPILERYGMTESK